MNEGFLVVQIGDVGMDNGNQLPSYQLIKINVYKEPKRLFYKSEISGISDGQGRALQMRWSKPIFPVRMDQWVSETIERKPLYIEELLSIF